MCLLISLSGALGLRNVPQNLSCVTRLGVSALNEARGDFRRGLAPKDGCKLCSGFLGKEATA